MLGLEESLLERSKIIKVRFNLHHLFYVMLPSMNSRSVLYCTWDSVPRIGA